MLIAGMEELQNDLAFPGDNGTDEAPSFLWKGATIPCIPSTETRGTMLEIGGKVLEITLTLRVLRKHFITADSTLITMDSTLYTMDNDTPTPVAGKKLTFRGRTYRIANAGEDAARAFFKLDLVDANSGR